MIVRYVVDLLACSLPEHTRRLSAHSMLHFELCLPIIITAAKYIEMGNCKQSVKPLFLRQFSHFLGIT